MEKINDKLYLELTNNQTKYYDFVKLNQENCKFTGFVGTLLIFITLITVANIKSNVKFQRKGFHSLTNENVVNSIYYILTYLTLPLLILLIPAFILLRQIVHIILKWRYQKQFGGLLESADAVWVPARQDTSRNIINIVITIRLNNPENCIKQIKSIAHQKIFEQSDLFVKLTSIRRRSMGFNFLLKNQLTADDCISTLKFESNDQLTERDLQEVISDYSNRPLPKEDSALWEILISPKPVYSESDNESKGAFPILLRFSHIVGDGLSLSNFFLRIFTDNNLDPILIRDSQNNSNFSHSENCSISDILLKFKRAFRNGFRWLKIMIMAPSMIIYQNVIRKEDINSLHGCQLSGNKILVCAIEKEKKFTSLVKKIKDEVPGCRFTDVLLSAISGSLENYFFNNAQYIPKFATAGIPALLSLPNMEEKPLLQNQFSVALLDLPILVKGKSMAQRLQEVMKETDKLRKSPDYQVNYWLLTLFCGIIPSFILDYVLKCDMLTMTISNVPGLPKLTVLDGCDVNDVVFYTPHRGKAGVGFSILTYDGRFQLGLEVDKTLISSIDEAQTIVNNIFRYIDLLAEELSINTHSQNVFRV